MSDDFTTVTPELLQEKYELARKMIAPDAETAFLGAPISSEAEVGYVQLNDYRIAKVTVRLTVDREQW